MTDPSDPFARWLAPADTDYLPPPPGMFDSVYRRARRRRWAKAGASTATLAVALVGGFIGVQHLVGPPGHGSAYQPGASASAPATVTPTTAGPSSRPPTPSSTSTSTSTGPVACTTGQVTVSAQGDPNSEGAGSFTELIIVTNTSTATCTVTGYPRVTYADRAHRAMSRPFGTSGGKAATVTLRPGGKAHVAFREILDPPAVIPNCTQQQAAGYLVALPGGSGSVFAAEARTICSNGSLPELDQPFGSGAGL
jgi:hypothetical protein